ncbi:MAG: ribonuclease III [Thermosipho sp. (in: Bacteria)]|nr:ribonuclease III [Thermosipho sp. (in: thermotogales)]MCD6104207.1 ribonuclease III [Thermosipho sp. (in: thermotogales)]
MERFSGRIKNLEKIIGYEFNSKKLLLTALSHTSYVNEQKRKNNKVQSYERLEFLGDAVVELLVCTRLYENYNNLSEGTMAQIKAAVASEDILSEIAKKLDLGSFILFGKGEEASGGRNKKSILADVFEALVAAVFIDSKKNLKLVSQIFDPLLENYITLYLKGNKIFDYKTKLQELTQEVYKSLPNYQISTEGENFKAKVIVNNKVYGEGEGCSKKEAEKKAAAEAYKKLLKEVSNNGGKEI